MSLPVKTLPVVQNWDCQATGSCCKEYVITLSDDEVKRIDTHAAAVFLGVGIRHGERPLGLGSPSFERYDVLILALWIGSQLRTSGDR